MTAAYLANYFEMAARLFRVELKKSWNELIKWLKGAESEQYRSRIRTALNRIRTGQD